MDKKLQLIRHLYGETDDRDALRELLNDEDLNHEYQELSEAKFWLDHTTHDRPDQTVLDTILAAAASEKEQEVGQHNTQEIDQNSPQLNRLQRLQQNIQDQNTKPLSRVLRDDRSPVARQPKQRRRLFTSVTAVLTLVVTIGIGYQFLQPQNAFLNESADQARSLQKSAPLANDPFAQSVPGASTESIASELQEKELGFASKDKKLEESLAPVLADLNDNDLAGGERSREANALLATGFADADSSLPDWDDDQDRILSYQRRIDMLLESNMDLAWDEAAVPLELLPAGRPANPALLQAGSRKSNTGNQ